MARRRTTRLPNLVNEEQIIDQIPLDRARILETALLLLDDIGLKELSMRKIAQQFRKVLLSHRDAVELFNQTIAKGNERITQIEKLFQLLSSAGFSDPHVPWITSMLKNYVQGFVVEEVQLHALARNHNSSYEEMGEQYDVFYRQLPEERFPNMIRLASYTTKTNWKEEFHFGLSILIDGFSAKLMRER